MSKVVNLRQARKRAGRAAKRQAADASAARHGVPKAERRLAEAESAREAARLDGHKRERED